MLRQVARQEQSLFRGPGLLPDLDVVISVLKESSVSISFGFMVKSSFLGDVFNTVSLAGEDDKSRDEEGNLIESEWIERYLSLF